MTVQKSLKRRVRARMVKTGERYAAARRQLLGTAEPTAPEADVAEASAESADAEAASQPPAEAGVELGTSSEALQRRTGRGWEEWFSVLDAWGAAERKHPEIATYLRDELGVDGWWAQNITVGYERARGLRAVGQLTDGFAASASKTVAAPVDRLFEAFVDPQQRAGWLPDGGLEVSSSTPGKSVRAAWAFRAGAAGRLDAYLTAKGPTRSSVAIQVRRLPDAATAEQQKAFWKERLAALAALLAG